MESVTRERFPHHRIIDNERTGAPDPEVCPKCSKRLDEPFSHMPAELGGGCIDHDDPACDFCGGVDDHERWCELARLER